MYLTEYIRILSEQNKGKTIFNYRLLQSALDMPKMDTYGAVMEKSTSLIYEEVFSPLCA